MKSLISSSFVASKSDHYDRIVGSFHCLDSVCDDNELSRCQESGSRVVFGNIKHSNPPPEKIKSIPIYSPYLLYQNFRARLYNMKKFKFSK